MLVEVIDALGIGSNCLTGRVKRGLSRGDLSGHIRAQNIRSGNSRRAAEVGEAGLRIDKSLMVFVGFLREEIGGSGRTLARYMAASSFRPTTFQNLSTEVNPYHRSK